MQNNSHIMKRVILPLLGVAIILVGCDKEEHGGTNTAKGCIDLVQVSRP